MAKKRKTRRAELARLYDQPAGELQLGSLFQKRGQTLSGHTIFQVLSVCPPKGQTPFLKHAYRWTIILPLLSETGEEVFSVDRDIGAITRLLDVRFGGCTTNAPTPQPPLHGSWMPDDADQPVIDLNTAITVYSRQLEAADVFFQYLKAALKRIGGQQEILIERASVWLPSAVGAPRK